MKPVGIKKRSRKRRRTKNERNSIGRRSGRVRSRMATGAAGDSRQSVRNEARKKIPGSSFGHHGGTGLLQQSAQRPADERGRPVESGNAAAGFPDHAGGGRDRCSRRRGAGCGSGSFFRGNRPGDPPASPDYRHSGRSNGDSRRGNRHYCYRSPDQRRPFGSHCQNAGAFYAAFL